MTLCPPDPLVIQVEAGGEYAGIEWTRTPIALDVSNGELVDFQQTFVRTVTSVQDWGLYQVTLCTLNCTQLTLPGYQQVQLYHICGGIQKELEATAATI